MILKLACKNIFKEVFNDSTVCFVQEMSLSRIVEGLELHHKLLQEIGAVLSSTEELNLLLADVTDLSAQLHEVFGTFQPL